MNDIFYKPYLSDQTAHFPYSRETLLEKPIFPALVIDCGAYLCANDILGSVNGDVMLQKVMDGSLFDYWRENGEFDWCAVSKRHKKIPYTSEYEAEIFLNRLYILQPLAQAYAKTRDKKYADIWFKILDHWRENNIYRGPDPTSLIWKDMQMSWRLVAMIYGIYLMGEDDTLTKEQWHVVYGMIRQHAEIMLPELAEDIEHKNMSNHVTLKAMALTLAGILLPELCDAAATIETVREYISIQMAHKYYADGTSREFGHTYRFFTTRLYVELELTLTKNGYAPIAGCNERMQRSYEFLYQFSTPSGMTPQIGDSYALDVDAEIEFVNTFYPLTFPRKKKSMLFADGQMVVLRNGKFTLLVEAMTANNHYPAGVNEYAHHIHTGRLQYLLYADGQPLVVDSGCPNYDRAVIYTPFAEETGHNVIRCDEVPVHEPGTLIRTGTIEDTVIVDYVADKKVSMRNTLTAADGKGYTWIRTFEMDEDSLTVTDEVEGDGCYHYDSFVHLAPAITGYCNYSGDPALEPMRADRRQLRLRFGSKFLYVETDTPVESAIQPCYNEENKLDYCQVLTRKFHADRFCEKTVYRF